MSEKPLENIHNQIITEFAKTVEMFDLSPGEARLFSILYLEGSPMTLDEMSEALGKSKTSISTGIRSLLDFNLVTRVWRKGVRKDLYMAEENLYKKFMSTFIQKWVESTKQHKHTLEEIESRLEENIKNGQVEGSIEEVKVRLKEMLVFHELIEESFREMKCPKTLSNPTKT
ncbi:GbsR/MarR family transcriptional regulator [Aquibacillus albus]|uniref:HTH-type transcriptional regulator n=1 Tax=Aquibacillus albus TaxID=1168171 RepID=A0ABS2N021_9BACI|nr:transcriptional regulator [Aquibacillus albus]MBM7571450.1 DNA-binding transcriptional regulator GbsR (MarR family) [Aquibacillus albus]